MVPPTNLPYYMKDGSIKPISPVGGESRKKRNLKLFPEEDPTNDRIIGKYHLLSQHTGLSDVQLIL